MKEQAAKAFMVWLKENDPFLFDVTMRAHQLKSKSGGQLSGIFDLFSSVNFADLAKTAVSTIKEVAPQVVQYNQQKKLLDIQVKRANQGLPPLDSQQYMVTVPGYQQGQPTPQQQQAIDALAYQSVNHPQSGFTIPAWAPFLAGGLGLFLLLRRKQNG